jgi:hypothetical protein
MLLPPGFSFNLLSMAAEPQQLLTISSLAEAEQVTEDLPSTRWVSSSTRRRR